MTLCSAVSILFLSTPSARRATVGEVPFTYLVLEFLSTPSARRATGCSTTTTPSQTYFYPRPPRGGRLETVKTTITGCYFYPRPPRGGRPFVLSGGIAARGFLSTPSARRAT